eukprot:scaffold1030_cov82-Skeletonema_marinoi.AAC.2
MTPFSLHHPGIEQGRLIISENSDGQCSSSSSWAAAAIDGGTSAPTTSTPTTVCHLLIKCQG